MNKGSGHLAFLVGAGIAVFGALIHWVAPFLGPDWYAFLHAPKWVVDSARNGTMAAPVGAVVIGFLMFTCASYAFSGAGLIRRLPFVKTGLAVISTICLLRSLLLVPYLVTVPKMLSAFDIVGSLVWFVAGVMFSVGAFKNWHLLSRNIGYRSSP
ncbi:hypothetical protein [Collimonas antrihumi]|uniref:hypothetical protein n=1 Tax=Collimonas antrihumi TaxID=1940615 RepID=UPI001B8B5493|nr:hypothetical protein [Collimonas antrihumi]